MRPSLPQSHLRSQVGMPTGFVWYGAICCQLMSDTAGVCTAGKAADSLQMPRPQKQ